MAMKLPLSSHAHMPKVAKAAANKLNITAHELLGTIKPAGHPLAGTTHVHMRMVSFDHIWEAVQHPGICKLAFSSPFDQECDYGSVVAVTLDGQGQMFTYKEGCGLVPEVLGQLFPNLQHITLKHFTLMQQPASVLHSPPPAKAVPVLPNLNTLDVQHVSLQPKSLVWDVAEATLASCSNLCSVAIDNSDMVTAFLWCSHMTRHINLTQLALHGFRDSHRLLKRLGMWVQGPTGPGNELYPNLTKLSLNCNLGGEDLHLLLRSAPHLQHLSLPAMFPMAYSLAALPCSLRSLHMEQLDLELLNTLPMSEVSDVQCTTCRVHMNASAASNLPALQAALQVAAACGGLKMRSLQASLQYNEAGLPQLTLTVCTFMQLLVDLTMPSAQAAKVTYHFGDSTAGYQHVLQNLGNEAVSGLLSKVVKCQRLSSSEQPAARLHELFMEVNLVCSEA